MYANYYEKHGADRNDLLANPEVVFQTFAFDRANIAALRRIPADRSSARVLDVGCGTGSSLLQFERLGFDPRNLSGVDNSSERIDRARALLPASDFRCENAESLSYADETFDIVFESTMLGTLDSRQLLERISREMVRVAKRGGHLVLTDWRYSRKGSGVETAMSRGMIKSLFSIGEATDLISTERGALVPPLGRFLSKRLPSLYFLVQGLVPAAVGQISTVLRRR